MTDATGIFGAAAAIGRILGLDMGNMAGSLGLAGAQLAGLRAFTADSLQGKHLHAGGATESGVMAAELVVAGFPGLRKILEVEDGGFCRAISGDCDLS